jgi:hypothetical protein
MSFNILDNIHAKKLLKMTTVINVTPSRLLSLGLISELQHRKINLYADLACTERGMKKDLEFIENLYSDSEWNIPSER